MRKIEVDAKAITAWAETGLTAGRLTDELDKYGLVLGFGDTGSVGIGGITLGGGVGFLARKFGLTIDNLLSAEIVTADGQILQVDNNNHPDLFWAIRGGGGNFGVASKFKYNLHQLDDCYGGLLVLPATAETISGTVAWAKQAPDEVSAIINIMPTFPMPMIPEKFQGQLSVMVMLIYAGNPAAGEKIVAPLKALAEPWAEHLQTMRYKDIFMPEQGDYHPTAVSRTMYLNNFSKPNAAEALDWLEKINAPVKALQLRVLGGYVAKVPIESTAYAHRNKAILANIAAFYSSELDRGEKQKWVEEFSKAIGQGEKAAYVGFSSCEKEKLEDVYPQMTLERLKQVKRKYDPQNLFRLNCNVIP
jgi:FAD/FMN-containing dehydrogenase